MPSSKPITVIDETSAVRCAETLAKAFSDNPGYVWAFPPEERREEKFRWYMQRVLALGMINGVCLQIGDGDGVAIWYEPGRTAGFIDLMRAGLYKLPFRLGLGIYLKIQKILNPNGHYMKKIMAGTPHYYLFHIGVTPAAQGHGFGSALIRYITDKADRERKVCYLETDRPGNIPFYEKHGFVLVDSKELSPGVPLWYMRRPAAGSA